MRMSATARQGDASAVSVAGVGETSQLNIRWSGVVCFKYGLGWQAGYMGAAVAMLCWAQMGTGP